MLSVAITAGSDPAPLELTLRALVPASVSGLVSDVLVVSPDPEALASLCEPMGAERAMPDEVGPALAHCRGEWLLVLEAGAQPLQGWDRAVAVHARPNARPGRFEVRGEAEPFWRRLFGRPGRPLMAGLLMPMEQARAAIRTTTLARLPVGRAAVTLPATLRVAPDPSR